MMPFFGRKIVCITGGTGFRFAAKALANGVHEGYYMPEPLALLLAWLR